MTHLKGADSQHRSQQEKNLYINKDLVTDRIQRTPNYMAILHTLMERTGIIEQCSQKRENTRKSCIQ
jgi:hypothetical protein